MPEIQSDILIKSTVAAFMLWLENEWSRYDNNDSLNVALVPNVEYIRQYRRLAQVEYPLGLMAMASINIDTEKGGFGKRFQNHERGRKQEDGTAFLANTTPVKVGCLFRFVSDNLDHILSLSSVFVDNNPGPSMVLKGNETGFRYECRVNINPDMEIPPLESGEDGKKYVIDTSIVMNSYMGRIRNAPLIKKIAVDYKTTSRENTLNLDLNAGQVIDLERRTLNYKQLFDTTSPHFKDQESIKEGVL